MNTWSKYDYVCPDCDSLIQITTMDGIPMNFDPVCPCGSNSLINIGVYDATVPDVDVTSITPRQVVQINTNPYN
jgi:hypothetical protein